MNKLFYIAACGLSLVVSSLQAVSATVAPPAPTGTSQQHDQTQTAGWMLEASQAAKDFLADMDKGNYPQVWTRGDEMFKNVITQNDWNGVAQEIRKPFGQVKSRTMKAENLAWDPQGLPKGAYMLIDYETVFDKQPSPTPIKESLSLRRGADGKWRVLTYQIN